MATPLNSAAQFICEKSNWKITQLSLQKILYLANMVHLGRGFGSLVPGRFEAWDYGPVHPELYRKVSMFGSRPIRNVFWTRSKPEGSAHEVLSEACNTLLNRSPGDLVRNTHWRNGAWAKHYSTGARNVVIPEASIIDEYKARVGTPEAA